MNKKPPFNYGATSSTDVAFLAQQRSQMFNSLCDNVVTNIYTVNSSLKILDNALKSIGTKKDNQALRNSTHAKQLSTNQIIAVTTKDIQQLKKLVAKSDKSQQLQVEKLEENFKEAITQYHELQKSLLQKQRTHLLVSPNVEHYDDGDEEQIQRQAQMTRDIAFDNDLMMEREAIIKDFEIKILDINQIMRELSNIVTTQGDVIDTIENSIDHAAGNIEEGTEQLIQASRYSNKYRKKLIILVFIGVIIAAILIGVLVTQLKK